MTGNDLTSAVISLLARVERMEVLLGRFLDGERTATLLDELVGQLYRADASVVNEYTTLEQRIDRITAELTEEQ